MSSSTAGKCTVIHLSSGPAVPRQRTLQLKRLYISFAVLAVLLLMAAPRHRVFAQQNVRAHPVRDLAVLKNDSGSYTIFVADSATELIRYREVQPQKEDVEDWELREFK